jgi:hypothetical protein
MNFQMYGKCIISNNHWGILILRLLLLRQQERGTYKDIYVNFAVFGSMYLKFVAFPNWVHCLLSREISISNGRFIDEGRRILIYIYVYIKLFFLFYIFIYLKIVYL